MSAIQVVIAWKSRTTPAMTWISEFQVDNGVGYDGGGTYRCSDMEEFCVSKLRFKITMVEHSKYPASIRRGPFNTADN